MITLQLNGEPSILPERATVRDAVVGVAVAVDGAVVPRSRWSATTLGDGQAVEIVTAVQGG